MTTDNNTGKPIKLQEFLGYAGPFIIFLGVLRLTTFYGAFHVQIIPYLDFAEILTSFLDVLIIVAVQAVFGIIQNFLSRSKSEVEGEIENKVKLRNQHSFIKRLRIYLGMLAPLLIVWALISLGFYICQLFHISPLNKGFLTYLITIIAVIVFILVFHEVELKHERDQSSHNTRMLMTLLLWSLFSIGLVFTLARNQINNILDEHATMGTKIVLDDRELISDKQNYFIGKTKNFIFFYHEKGGNCDIFPMSRVKQIGLAHHQKK